MPDPAPNPLPPSDAQREAAQARLQRDILLSLTKAGVCDVEVAMLLVERKLAASGGDSTATPDAARIAAALGEVLDERPQLLKPSGTEAPARAAPSLPGPLPVYSPQRPSHQAARQEALARARGSRSPADLADYLRLRRRKS